ncbi:hypothetical protein EON82_11470 [bacterium]|nr:MAG: hypothetical protein EON82_11470 [bacterium]
MLSMALLQAITMSNALPPTEITVYNQGFGLVKEARTLNLKKGRQTVGIEDVAAQIDPSSVSIRSLLAPDALTVLEQNYQYDLIGPASILAKAVGERLRVVGPKETFEGTLISSPGQNGGGLVLRTDDGRIVLDPQGQITLAKVPEGLITRPTLLWDLQSGADGAQDVELSYITRGLSWSADYVLTLDGKGKGALQGWVTMNNQSGTTYKDARLKLLAGDVNQAPQGQGGMGGGAPRALAMMADKAFNEESLFEYHLYTLQRPATIKDKEIKQLGLLSGDEIPLVRRLIVDAMRPFGRYYPQEGEVGTGDIAPQVRIEFMNDKKSGLGMPLPAGRFRLYQRDASGSTQLLGEDRIEHTPKDERVSLVVGRSFDVRATRKRLSFERLGPTTVRESFSIEVRNRKDVPETVEILERYWGDWKVTAKNMEFVKEDANSIRFSVPLKAGESKTVTYTAETRW